MKNAPWLRIFFLLVLVQALTIGRSLIWPEQITANLPWPATTPFIIRGTFGIDFWHAWVHIAWGAAGVALLATQRTRRAAVGLALIFGVFYTALGVLGVAIHHPLGLELDWFENGFHLTAGPLTLLLGAWAVRRQTAERAGVGQF